MNSKTGSQSSPNRHDPKPARLPLQAPPPVYRPTPSIQQKKPPAGPGRVSPAPLRNIVQAKAVEVRPAPPVYRPLQAVQTKPQPARPAISAALKPAQPVLRARAIESRPAPPAYRPATAMQRAVAPPANPQAQRVAGFQNRPMVPHHPPSIQRMMAPGTNMQLPGGPAVRRQNPPPPSRALHAQVLQRLVLTVGHVDEIIGRSVLRLA